MKVYVFGNEDCAADNLAFEVASKLDEREFEFIAVKPNQDLPFIGEDRVVILDTVYGIDKVTVFTEKNIDKLKLSPRSSVHDFDLGFQLKYLRKIGKISDFKIAGLPVGASLNIFEVEKVLRRL